MTAYGEIQRCHFRYCAFLFVASSSMIRILYARKARQAPLCVLLFLSLTSSIIDVRHDDEFGPRARTKPTRRKTAIIVILTLSIQWFWCSLVAVKTGLLYCIYVRPWHRMFLVSPRTNLKLTCESFVDPCVFLPNTAFCFRILMRCRITKIHMDHPSNFYIMRSTVHRLVLLSWTSH